MVQSEGADGENILYHYIQKNILARDDEFSKELVKRLIRDLSIWLPTNLYKKCPILLPYVVRDPTCRQNRKGREEAWGSPDERGFFRDDNSLIKGIPRSYIITSKTIASYHNRKLGRGFVAGHVWRKLRETDLLASKYYKTNSFVPNLVWLPKQVSKLTDREGSLAQKYLQFLSSRIYRSINVYPRIKEIWSFFEIPTEFDNEKIDHDKINFFKISESQIFKRIDAMNKAMMIIKNVENAAPSRKKLHCSRYLEGLKKIQKSKLNELYGWLDEYTLIIQWGCRRCDERQI